MLKKIPNILSPELLKVLMEMGHSDTIVIADGNFPGETMGKRVIRMDGHGVPQLLDAILEFFPLDTYVEFPVSLMEVVKGDPYVPEIWDKYKEIINNKNENINISYLERFKFYEKAKKAYAVIMTGETALYANIILQKGVVV